MPTARPITFEIAYDVDSEDELGDLIDTGEARAGLIIPADYTNQIKSNGSAEVMFILDGSDPTVASTALSAAQMIGQQICHPGPGPASGAQRPGNSL